MDSSILELLNGLRIVYLHLPHSSIAHSGFVINLGTRHEPAGLSGLAHFYEHMLFKGTENRKYYHINNRLDVVGGDLNAYTTKDKICVYSAVGNVHFERSLELLSDLIFNANFPEVEIEREKGVVLDEMGVYLDSYEERIFDEFEELCFKNNPLGSNILGTKQSLKAIDRSHLLAFKKRVLNKHNLVFCYAGPLSCSKFLVKINRHLGQYKLSDELPYKAPKAIFNTFEQSIKLNCGQSYAILGWQTTGYQDDNKLLYLMLANLLGGDSLNSKLNMKIREKLGLVYQIEASFNPFEELGLFQIAYSCAPKNVAKINENIAKITNSTMQIPFTEGQFRLHKQQFMGKILMAEEHKGAVMLGLGKSLLDFGKIEPLSSIFDFLKAQSPQDMQQIAKNVFSQKPACLTFDPK